VIIILNTKFIVAIRINAKSIFENGIFYNGKYNSNTPGFDCLREIFAFETPRIKYGLKYFSHFLSVKL
jgi:hypothetical protein